MSRMTDIDKLKSLLDEWGVPYEEEDWVDYRIDNG
jgi:hypothetical protein